MQLQDNRFARLPGSRTKPRENLAINRLRTPQIRLIRLGKKYDPRSIIAPKCAISLRCARGTNADETRIHVANMFQIIAFHLTLRQVGRKSRNLERHAEVERPMMTRNGGDLPAAGQNQRNTRVWIRIVRA